MKVILKQKVRNVGDIGDVVDVANGFAENFLFPKKLAQKVTNSTLQWAKKVREERIAKMAEIRKKAQEFAKKLGNVTLIFKRKTTKDGKKLFGAVAEKDILQHLLDEQKIKLEKKQIKMPHHFKEVGEYEVEVHLAEDVNVMVKVEVVPEEE